MNDHVVTARITNTPPDQLTLPFVQTHTDSICYRESEIISCGSFLKTVALFPLSLVMAPTVFSEHLKDRSAQYLPLSRWLRLLILVFSFLITGIRSLLPPKAAMMKSLPIVGRRLFNGKPGSLRMFSAGTCYLSQDDASTRRCLRWTLLQRTPSVQCVSSTTRRWSSLSNSAPEKTGQNTRGQTTEQQQHSEYEHWVRRLYMTNMYNPVKLGLENIQKLHDLLGNPMDDPNVAVIHIAGTNGKGSVALKIAKTLELMGLKVGLFCSPHVSSFRERMQMNSQLISEEEVVECLPRIYDICKKHDIPATFFEITTALAFMYYHKSNADVVVLETGLGGRLDSTNVVKSPACSVITSIGLEHTRILGDTIEKIAVEKGGIIKPNRPVLVGPHVPHEVLRQCAREKAASGYYTCGDFLPDTRQTDDDVPDYDEENARIAAATLRLLQKERAIPNLTTAISDEIMQQGTSQRPPCRFEEVQREEGLKIILDVAHNPPAMHYLVQKLKNTYKDAKFRIVVGMSSDKDSSLCGKYILDAVQGNPGSIHLVQASHPRAAKIEDILSSDSTDLLKDSHYDFLDRSVTRQIGLALALTKQNNEILVVCGSVFLMAEAREALGFNEPRDSEYIAEVAGAHLRHGQENFDEKQSSK